MISHVTYEIAKMLKTNGFDELCSHYYIDNFQNFKHDNVLYKNMLPSDCDSDNIYQYVKRKNQLHLCNAPTISQTVMWLYEKYNIWIEVRKSYLGGFVGIVKHHRMEMPVKDTPTQAYIESILYALKNIK